MRTPVPAAADVVVVGGGVIGVSSAYQLAAAGLDVVLVERDELGAGSTSRAAGGVRAQFSDAINIALGARSLDAFARFGEEHGHDIGLHRDGYLFLLSRADDVAAFERGVELQRSLGVPSRLVEPAEAARLCPVVRTDDLLAAAFSPLDGHCTPEAVVAGYAASARRLGATLLTHCTALEVETRAGEITAVRTDRGRVATSVVVCAAGAWSRGVAALVGVDLPVVPLRRQIVITEPLPWLPAGLPMTIDFTTTFYFHPERDKLLIGMSDPLEQPGFRLDRSDEWLPRLHDAIAGRAPALLDAGISGGWAGLYEVTPDHNALIGEAAAPSRFVYATGFSGHGFLQGPAVGEVVRDLVLERAPFVDVAPLSADRFARRATRAERNVV